MGETGDRKAELARRQKLRRVEKRDLIRAQRKAIYWADVETNRAASKAYYDSHKEHAAAYAREYRRHNVGKRRMQKRRRTYGITADDFLEMWNLQAGRCAICLCRLVDDGSGHTHVDHDHRTGAVRGLLCVDCNVALGRFKDDIEAVRRAAEYLGLWALGRLEPRSVLSNGRDGR
jgi:hypothetical protein